MRGEALQFVNGAGTEGEGVALVAGDSFFEWVRWVHGVSFDCVAASGVRRMAHPGRNMQYIARIVMRQARILESRQRELRPMPVPSQREVHARTLLRDDVYVTLRDAIVRGELVPGEQLRDSELSAWLGVSRTPIREALLRLGRAGLVVATPGRLTAVAPEDPQRVLWAQQIVSELHALATRVAVGAMQEEDYVEMIAANSRLELAISAGDAGEAIRADDAFHAVPVRVAGNPLILEQLEGVAPMLHRAEYMHFGARPGVLSPERHTQIVAAMRVGEVDEAVALVRQNWESLGE